ncbi:MAG: YkvA family protein [Beijerinckiaceae bacterium]
MAERPLARLRAWARTLKQEVVAVGIAARDPRTPRVAKFVAIAIVAYAVSPIDLIPDAIPILGQIDDLVLVPLGLWLALRMIPPDALLDARMRASSGERLTRSRIVVVLIVAVWIASAVLIARQLF